MSATVFEGVNWKRTGRWGAAAAIAWTAQNVLSLVIPDPTALLDYTTMLPTASSTGS